MAIHKTCLPVTQYAISYGCIKTGTIKTKASEYEISCIPSIIMIILKYDSQHIIHENICNISVVIFIMLYHLF